MDIRDLLALEPSIASIKKIDQFLSAKMPNDRDYPKAISHLAYLTYLMGDVSNSFQLLFNYLDKCIDKEKPTVYNALIKIYYEQKDYENVLKMIELKKEFLPSYNKSAYYEDLIRFYQETSDEVSLRRNLLIYLADDISDERRLKALTILCDILFKNGEYEFEEEDVIEDEGGTDVHDSVLNPGVIEKTKVSDSIEDTISHEQEVAATWSERYEKMLKNHK